MYKNTFKKSVYTILFVKKKKLTWKESFINLCNLTKVTGSVNWIELNSKRYKLNKSFNKGKKLNN